MGSVKKILGALLQLAIIVAAVVFLAPLVGVPIAIFIGSVVGAVASNLIFGSGKPSTRTEVSTVNVRISEPVRWLNAGNTRQGGAVLFAEFDTAGNLWYLIVHSDSILVNRDKIYLDETEVTVDGAGNVLHKDFRLTNKFEPVTVNGAGNPYVQIWTTTYSESNPTPPAVGALSAAFLGKWTSDHKLVGTTYTVVKMKALKAEHRNKIYRYRGPLGLGEPSVAVVGDWSNVYDPRDVGQVNGTPTTHLTSRNAVLIWAWFRTHRYGRNKSRDSINWNKVAEQATICDETVIGIVGSHVRYRCDISIPEDRARSDVEMEIMMTADMQLVFDDDGKCWPRVGYYHAPTVSFSRNRDIVALESVEAQNGESETQGVIIRYTDPAVKYGTQPSAAWLNPLYYVPGQSATFLTIDALAIQDHNQAMRIAKAIGMRMQPAYKIAPTVGLRGLKARQERIVNINYDNTFAGDHEICTQVEVDPAGIFCGMGLVPVNSDRWSLLPGEEKPKPVVDGVGAAVPPNVPTGVTTTFQNGRIESQFTAPLDGGVNYEFEYILTSEIADDTWSSMTSRMGDDFAYSGTVVGEEYTVRHRAVTAGGLVSDWSTPDTLTPDPTFAPSEGVIYEGGVVLP